jgi:hypothetical protein
MESSSLLVHFEVLYMPLASAACPDQEACHFMRQDETAGFMVSWHVRLFVFTPENFR